MRRYNCNSFDRTSPWLRVSLACFINFFTGGVIYGWSALEHVYEGENVSSQLCAANETLPCSAQTFYLGLVFSVASTGNMCAGLPMGLLVDLAGPRIAHFVSELFVVVGAFMLAFGYLAPEIYLPAFLILGIGGTGVQVSLMHTCNLFPQHKSNVTNAIHACFQLSFLIFALFQLLYDTAPNTYTSWGMFLVYAFIAVLCLVAGLFWPGRAYGPGHGKSTRKSAAVSVVLPPGGFHRKSIAEARKATTTVYSDGDGTDAKSDALVEGGSADYHLHEEDDEDDIDATESDLVVVNTMGVMTTKSMAGNQQRLVSKSIAARAAGPSMHKAPEFDPITATFKQQILAGHLWACVVFITIGIVFSNSFIATLGE